MSFQCRQEILQLPSSILVKRADSVLSPASNHGPHSHHTLEISMITSGVGEYRVGELVYPVSAGDILIFNNIESHGMWNTGETDLTNVALEFEPRFIWSDPGLSFDKSFLSMFFSRSPSFQHKLDPTNPAFAGIQAQFREVCREFAEKPPYYEMIVKAKLMVLLADIHRGYRMMTSDSLDSFSRYSKAMQHVQAYIAAHYTENLSVEQLADMMHISPSYFFQIFREVNGLSPKDYIIRMRVMAAIDMLETTSADVLSISQTCGFNSLSNFYAAFKRTTGKSPVKYREQLIG